MTMMNHTNSSQGWKAVAAYLAAGVVMICLSYWLPRWLPGNFVEAMYASSHVTLNAQQEAESKCPGDANG